MFYLRYILIFRVIAVLLLLTESLVFAQSPPYRRVNRVPVYRSTQDSVMLSQINEQIDALRNTRSVNEKKLDSLVWLYEKQYAHAIKGFRNIYAPARDHTSLDSLLKMADRSAVTRVSIHEYFLSEFPEVIFECTNLESLELVNTNISALPERLNSLSRLKAIRIYNPVTKRRIKLQQNTQVTTLVIRGDRPGNIPRNFRPYIALETLDLSGNNLRRFPNGARRNPALKELVLRNNMLTLRGRLKKHPSVETLALQHNSIRHVPRGIKRFRNLTKLNFNYNQIRTAHSSIGNLKNLEHLSFYRNALPAIPDGVYALENLREIDLFFNQIYEVSSRIQQLKKLKTLYLSHNQLTSIPESIGTISTLEGLYVWNNQLDALPESLGELESLRFLWVNNNNLRALPPALFQLKRIEELDVSHNLLTEIPEAVFDFPSLKILSLIDNPWNDQSLSYIRSRGAALRTRGVSVHIPGR